MLENPGEWCRPCVFCGEKETRFRVLPLGKKESRLYVFCPSCGGIFCGKEYLPSFEKERERYLLHKNSATDEGYRSVLEGFLSSVLGVLGTVNPSALRILDFGCGPSPVLVNLCRERGWSAFGFDPVFFPGGCPESFSGEIRPGIFDLVLCHECAEHFHSPVKTFSEMSSFIKPEGFCAVSTHFVPPVRTGEKQDGKIIPCFPDFFEKWWYRMDFTHVSFYSSGAMEKTAFMAGLEPVCPVFREKNNGTGAGFMIFKKRQLF